MDDLLTGDKLVMEAVKLQIHKTPADANFPLRKYMSNWPEFLAQIDSELIEQTRTFSFSNKSAISLLGMCWQPSSDSLSIKLQLRKNRLFLTSLIKGQLLSEIARIYDLIGTIVPVTIRAKLLPQEVWREKCQWDDIVSENIMLLFASDYNDLENLVEFEIRRRYSRFDNPVTLQFVRFCNASERAYAAVVYFCSIDQEGNIDI